MKGPHSYPGISPEGEFMYTSDCAHKCGCWMGSCRSGGPDGVNPFGECPNAPEISVEEHYEKLYNIQKLSHAQAETIHRLKTAGWTFDHTNEAGVIVMVRKDDRSTATLYPAGDVTYRRDDEEMCEHGEPLRNPCTECDGVVQSHPQIAFEPDRSFPPWDASLRWDPRMMGDAAKLWHAQTDRVRTMLESNALENPSGLFNVGFCAGHATAFRKVKAALDACHQAFRERKHGGVAEAKLRHAIEELLNQPYDA
jgi:hypothetical protein